MCIDQVEELENAIFEIEQNETMIEFTIKVLDIDEFYNFTLKLMGINLTANNEYEIKDAIGHQFDLDYEFEGYKKQEFEEYSYSKYV